MQIRSGEDHLHAHHHRAVRHAPAIGVEHRRHRQHAVGALQSPVIAEATDEGVQDRRAVRVDDALGAAGGARRVAHRDRIVLVVRLVVEAVGVGVGEQGFVVEELTRHRRAGEREHDDLLEAMGVGELAVQRQQHVVDDQEAVGRIAGDPAEVRRRQAQVQGVHHPARGRDAEVALEVRMVVP